MKLHELFESSHKHVAFCFGRMNPPTIGHKQLFDSMSSIDNDYLIFTSQTQDRKNNPLDYNTKINFLKQMFPNHARHIVDNSNLNTIGKVCSYIYSQGYNHVTFVAGDDRLSTISKIIKDYNGVEGKAHGYYKFETISEHSSGNRDPDGEGISSVSASQARIAAANNEFEKFSETTGAGQYAEQLFIAVRKGMGIEENKK